MGMGYNTYSNITPRPKGGETKRRFSRRFAAGGSLYERAAARMNCEHELTKEESFFAVFCIESLAEELHIPGDEVYMLLTEKSDLLDSYIIPSYEPLHTQGKAYIVRELLELMKQRGVLG
jgi:hypothetical protein